MKHLVKIVFLFSIIILSAFTQAGKADFSFGGKTGNCKMTWDEFLAAKKELSVTDKNTMIGSFLLTVSKVQKKDSTQIEFPSKGNLLSKSSIDAIKKLKEDKKLGTTMVIDHVQIQQSGKEARIGTSMIITLN